MSIVILPYPLTLFVIVINPVRLQGYKLSGEAKIVVLRIPATQV